MNDRLDIINEFAMSRVKKDTLWNDRTVNASLLSFLDQQTYDYLPLYRCREFF